MKYIRFAVTFFIIFLVYNAIGIPYSFRFSNPALNYLFVIFSFCSIPFIFFIFANFKKKGINHVLRIFGVLSIAPCFFIAFFVYIFGYGVNENGVDLSYEKIEEVSLKNTHYRLYRTNGGATTAFGLSLRKEMDFPLGIKMVKVIFSKYEAMKGTLIIKGDNTLNLTIESYGEKHKLLSIDISV